MRDEDEDDDDASTTTFARHLGAWTDVLTTRAVVTQVRPTTSRRDGRHMGKMGARDDDD